jgi:methyltransferase (TIGR00027 family)
MVIVACEQHVPDGQRLVDDSLAAAFLPPGLRLLARACRWPSVRNLLIRASEKKAPGVWGGMACRKRYIDEKVTQAIQDGVDAMVILGAGLDTRAYRLVAPTGVHTYEVDLPANISYKHARLRALYGGVPEYVTLVLIDFEHEDLGAVLAAHGFRTENRTLFLWEAVTQYLTEDAVERLSRFFQRLARGAAWCSRTFARTFSTVPTSTVGRRSIGSSCWDTECGTLELRRKL